MTDITPDRILTFWFEDTPRKNHFVSTPAFDAKVRRLFAAAIEREARRCGEEGHPWLGDADEALALIILFDQFTRNVWRGSGKAFAFDPLARKAAEAMIAAGFDWAVHEDRRAFVYMPFMHSEDLADQDRCIALCAERLPDGNNTVEHARKHREVIAQFRRFPYRNDALGRVSTPAERNYLRSGGYAPGSKGPANSS
ncbi:DUF924 family protein [Hyphobacterium marinum]|uniref:DUF924 family protein n=1 Tax=Hyphobacterium marinum TaxID=3116574 RepID=A0ABU7LYF2_9PROT|nr:DUF924 family protein [Hyphobacterium sp. Y6023]MEE2566297.1 DUF924 family protein [Hyphobacterium sp. Y6023]